MSGGVKVVITALLPKEPQLTLKLIGQETFQSAAGGWTEVKRNLREPLPVWTERPLWQVTYPLQFDGYSDWPHRRIDGDARSLEDWASSGRRKNGEHNPPTPVRIAALDGTLRNFATGMNKTTKWIITGLEWGEFITDTRGVRIRQNVNVTLTEYITTSPTGYAEALREALGITDEDEDDDKDDKDKKKSDDKKKPDDKKK